MERLPRTSGTSIPPLDRGDRARRAGSGRERHDLAVLEAEDSPRGRAERTSHDREIEIARRAQHRPDERDLERGRALGISDEPVREAQGFLVERAGHGHAEGRPAVTPEVLHRREEPGLEGEESARLGHSRKRTRSPGAKRKGGSARRSKSRRAVRPRRFQPPGVGAG